MRIKIDVSEDLAFLIANFERVTRETNLIEDAVEIAIKKWYDENTTIKNLVKEFKELIKNKKK